MGRQEFTVRINRQGQIFIEVDGLPVREVKDLLRYFEETLGPAQQVADADGGPDGGVVEIDDLHGRTDENEDEAVEENRQRLRLRDAAEGGE